MGNISSSIRKINYEEVQMIVKKEKNCLLINTLNSNEQNCLIQNTILADKEEELINNLIYKNKNKYIAIYGKNNTDFSVYKKYNQLLSLGFKNIYIYIGGMFEWCLLQDIYGEDNFKTTCKVKDILYYKTRSTPEKNQLLLL
ncbi:MAG: hypothetical protein CMF80_06820 [Candidatus Marinimicrobia bacterium]|nr:hypothetical protein [Candidatus Neomarinimicrobiota bacterium]